MTASRRALTIPLGLLALAGVARADPSPRTWRWRDPQFSVTLPAGWSRVDVRNARGDHLGTFRQAGGLVTDAPMVVQLVDLDAVIPQRPFTEAERNDLRRSDPLPFDDRVERATVMGYPVDMLVGAASLSNGQRVLRLASVIPLVDDGVLVVVMGPMARSAEARGVMRAVLSSAAGRTGWHPGWWRPAMRLAQGLTALAAALTAMHLVGAVWAYARWPVSATTRARVTTSAAVMWLAVAALSVELWPSEWLGPVLQAGLLAFACGWAARRAKRPPPTDGAPRNG